MIVRLAAWILLIALALGLAGCRDSLGTTPAGGVAVPLRVDDGEIVDAAGDPVTLRGFNMIPVWSDRPGRTWSDEHYERIAAAGFNTVRFVLHWDELQPQPQPGALDETSLRTLDRALAAAERAGLVVVLDMIHVFDGESRFPGWARADDPLVALERHAESFVTALVKRYRDAPAVVAYDAINEPPSHPPDQRRILSLYDRLGAAIRSIDPEALIMVSPAFGDTVLEPQDLSALSDRRNVVVTLHDYYAGGAGDGYAADGAPLRSEDGAAYTWDGVTGYDPPAPRELEQHLRRNLEVVRAAGMPVWIGEFGIGVDAPNARRWVEDKVRLFDRLGVGYAWWIYERDDLMSPLDDTGEFRDFVATLAAP